MEDSTAIFSSPSQLLLNQDQTCLDFDDGPQPGQDLDDLFDTDNLFSDPLIQQLCNDDDFSVNDSGFTHRHHFNHPQNPVSIPMVPRTHFNCACCQILREITHTNGVNVKRLEIHGVFGIITHAVLGIFDCCLSVQTQDFQMFDFQKESTVTVKKFLVQYYEACRQEGYSPIQDPLSTFYEALSVGFNEPSNTNGFLQSTPEFTSMKIPLSMQRERTRNLGVKDFVEYFHLPIEEAARKLNICPTVMKKICRKHGVLRWPHRKIKSIERKISKSEKILEASADEERTRALQDKQKYLQQLSNIYAEFNVIK